MKVNRRQIAWVLYDWGNSAFATTIMAAVLPVFYKTVAAHGLAENISTSYWAYTHFAAAFLVALLSPPLGALGDRKLLRKKLFTIFMVTGVIATTFMGFTGRGDYLLLSLLYIAGALGFSLSEVFYNSFLPFVAKEKERDFISSLGYATGYLGGGILLLINVLMITRPGLFGIKDSLTATRLSIISVGIWWFIFSFPFLIWIKEPKIHVESSGIFRRLALLKKYPNVLLFLISFWLYNDGISTIIKMAVAYGVEIGIGTKDLIIAILITQFVGIFFTMGFAKIAEKLNAKKGIIIGLFVYLGIVIWGYFMKSATEFYILAILVGTVQGGTQALSRSMYSNLIPQDKSAEFFGFFSMSSRFSTILGPLLFGLVSQFTGNSRNGVFSLAFFFVLGGLLLLKVKERNEKV